MSEIDKRDYLMDPVDQWLLAREHNVQEWNVLAFEKLVHRQQWLKIEDCERLGAEMTCRVYQARENQWRGQLVAEEDVLQDREPLDVIDAWFAGPQAVPVISRATSSVDSADGSPGKRAWGAVPLNRFGGIRAGDKKKKGRY